MLLQLLIIYFLIVLQCSLGEPIDRSPKSPLDVKIGFLVGSRRAKNDRSYSRPGRLLVHAFNYGLDKINQQLCDNQTQQQANSPSDATSIQTSERCIKFVPVLAETFGNETESIKQTVALVTKHRVNFILGPQETCQVESRLAAAFNVGMISHYCSQYTPDQAQGLQQTCARSTTTTCTFIQTKPPHWKIVQRVATLVGQLLAAHNGWYPQRLVLLYYKEPISEVHQALGADKRATNGWLLNSSLGQNARAQSDTAYMVSDALPYKLIGELLEIELNHLFSARQQSPPPPPPLTVLNWHTTFHYGKTRNPFQRLIRRHLFQRHHNRDGAGSGQVAANQSGLCANEPASARSTSGRQIPQVQQPVSEAQKSAIYIIVGHYYEHLGLLLALDELNLLGQAQQQQQQQQLEKAPQSSVPVNQRESLVIGVDIEQYDERDDSVRYLRGLLMDEKAGSPSDSLDSIAAMYRNYMGVMPAKPTRSGEFLDDIRAYYNQTTNNPPLPLQPSDDPDNRPSSATANQTTLDAILQTTRLFQFIRLPVEAYYLYDSLALLAAYFQHCIRSEGLSLGECSDGRRAFQWFRNREYLSYVDHELTKFDSQAQTDGHYTLISRALINGNNLEPAEDESFSLLQVGRFVVEDDGKGARHRIELHVDADGVDPIWLPLWCHVRQSNISACVGLINNQTSGAAGNESSQLPHPSPPTTTTTLTTNATTTTTTSTTSDDNTQTNVINYWLAAAGFVLTLVALLYMIVSGDGFYPTDNGESLSGDNSRLGWFNERDEQNFLDIVHNHLLTPEILHHQTCGDGESTTTTGGGDGILEQRTKTLELHCHMFPFPSCRFVHWLTALLQLKEMMFQYQSSCSNITNDRNNTTSTLSMRHRLGLSCARNQSEFGGSAAAGNRGFFRLKHKGTGSLRILLNKYKAINECFCHLSRLDSDRVVKLHGASLSRTSGGECAKIVHLLVERPQRGSLRESMEKLKEIIDLEATKESIEFRELVVLNSMQNLLDGLEYLHGSELGFHGELAATNCLITCDWQLKLSGFHEFHMRRSLGEYEQRNCSKYYLESNYYNNLIYAAPEVIADHRKRYSLASDILRLADFYSAAFVIYELLVGREPWACLTQVTCARMLVERVQADCSFRPPLSLLANKDFALICRGADLDGVQRTIRSCWSQAPERRPQSVESLRNRLTTSFAREAMQKGQLMSRYASLLERVSVSRKERLEREQKRSTELRLRLLPESVASKLSSNQRVPVQQFDSVALCVFRFVLKTDPAHNPIEELNEILTQLDLLVESYRKRIHLMDSHVDSLLRHMVFAGEPLHGHKGNQKPRGAPSYNDCQLIASFALQLIDLANRWHSGKGTSSLQVRCGLHCGPVLGGLILGAGGGCTRASLRNVTRANDEGCLTSTVSSSSQSSSSSCFNAARYVIYGNTLQMADVLESSCVNQRIQLSHDYRLQLQLQSPKVTAAALERGVDIGDSRINQAYVVIKRESKISSKMFGEFEAHWLLNGPRLSGSQSIMLLSE